MRRYVPALLLLLAACSDLTNKPAAPPVALSVLTGSAEGAAAEEILGSAGQTVRLLRAVSPRALFTLHVPDLKSAVDRFQETGLYRWLSSPELKRLFSDSPLQMAIPQGAGVPDIQQILRSLRGEVVFCVESVDPAEASAFDGVRLLAGMTVRGSEARADEVINFLTTAATAQDGVHVEKGTVGGHPYSRIVGKKPTPWVVELALYDDALLAGLGRETVTAAMDRLQSDEQPSLAEEPSFQGPMTRGGDPRDALRVHLAVGTLLERFGPLLPADVTRVLKALGLDGVRSLAMAVRCEGNDIVLSQVVDSPGGKDFLTQLLSAHTIDRSFLDLLPADTASFSLFAIDGRRIIRAARDALAEGPRREFEETLATLKESGLDVETDVFDVFGPRCALVNVPTDRPDGPGLDAIWGQLLGTALVCDVLDPARARAILDRLPERSRIATRRAVMVEGVAGFAYRFETDQLPDDLSICYALVDNRLVVAASEAAFKRMLRRRSPQTAERFRGLLREVPENAAVVTYDDLQKGPGAVLESLLAGLPGGAPLPGERRHLGPSSGILRNLGPSLSYTVADSNGVLTVTRSPTGGFGSLGGLGGLLMMAAIAVPNLQQARVEQNEAAAVSTLRAIQTAQNTFRSNALRDTDGDGEGEFGFLGELLGQPRAGEKRARSASPLVSGTFQRAGNDFARGGYRFRVYLPAEDGTPIGENDKEARIKRVDGDIAETVMVVVAWPVSKGMSGHRSFYLDAEGRLLACLDGPYAGEKSPPPDVMSSQENNLASRQLRDVEPSRDGNRWVRVR
ncbi:MAG TPA: hypothetical protein VFY93_07040 [Planctomycetota bacterium]|nr:hypothetical protein [Planctomycetota bacterium]